MSQARLLMLAPFPREAAYTRYRLLQFVPDLASAGIAAHVVPFLSSADFRDYYGGGGHARRAMRLACAVGRRILAAARATAYDAVLLGREALLFGPPWIEAFLTRVLRKPLLFDFDDAIFLRNPNTAWGRWSGLAARCKCPGKTDAILAASKVVLAGNSYLAEYARRFNPHVMVMPTVVDADQYPDATCRSANELPVVGWIGTHTTARFLDQIAAPLAEVASRRDYRLRLVGAGPDISLPGAPVESVPWTLEGEAAQFAALDIGLYPLPDSPWTHGKCGFKAIQYLAAGVPTICSPVGVTTEIVEHGRTGLWARTDAGWVDALDRLLEDAAERRSMGTRGRRAVREHWSRQVHAPRFVETIGAAIEGRATAAERRRGEDCKLVVELEARPHDAQPTAGRARG
jgi:glycosyltransferase involved in cell wall biosynthesis